MIRFALVGTGGIARWHVEALRRVPNAKLEVVLGRNVQRLKAFAARNDIPAVERFHERVFDKLPVDAVLVATEPEFHAAAGIAAARAGKHVLVEKPIEVSTEAAGRLIEECKKAGVRLSVVAQKRFDPRYRWLKELLAAGTLGDFRLGLLEFVSHRPPAYYEDSPWRKGPAGGILVNHLIHWIDLWLDLLGTPDEAVSLVERVKGGHAEAATCSLVYRGLGMVTLQGTLAYAEPLPARFTYVGARGRFDWTGACCTVHGSFHFPWSWQRWCLGSRWSERLVPPGDLFHQLQDWTESLLHNRPPAVSPETGLAALKIALGEK
jgi:predicted dehydrogenase